MGQLLAQNGIGLVYGGSTSGLMGAVADAVLAHASGYAIGVRPGGNLLPSEGGHAGLSEMVIASTMQERKRIMSDTADFFVALPGGPGTLDELTEMISARHLKHHDKPIFALNTNEFWTSILSLFDKMEEAGFMRVGRRAEIFQLVATPEELIAKL